ncbi:MAG: MarR family winged helix-turn-helix transcriptional regulator [Actinomycetota bacterium]|nr:MarR family winged helix-turn-helix transcriptional regulator [Actinomycetota bacterium]
MPDPTSPALRPPVLDHAVVAMRELILSGEHYRTAVAVHLGLTVNESQAVSYLLARGPIGQGELAAAMSFTTSSTTALVDRLERRGVAERRNDPTDRRRSIIALSSRGEAELDEVRTWMAKAFSGLDEQELGLARDLLLTLASNLRGLTDSVLASQGPHSRPRRRL